MFGLFVWIPSCWVFLFSDRKLPCRFQVFMVSFSMPILASCNLWFWCCTLACRVLHYHFILESPLNSFSICCVSLTSFHTHVILILEALINVPWLDWRFFTFSLKQVPKLQSLQVSENALIFSIHGAHVWVYHTYSLSIYVANDFCFQACFD